MTPANIPLVKKGRHWHDALFYGLLLFGMLLPAILLYQSGLSGGFQLDDRVNLQRLASDDTGLFAFLANVPVGGLGRPLSYLSFYWQKASYPQDPTAFLYANLGIHLFNVMLLFWLVLGLTRARRLSHPLWIALSVAMVWSILPVHVSSVLYIIQRMTLLSATFMLLACAGYVHARLRTYTEDWHWQTGLQLSFWVVIGYLGVFAKENAILVGLALALIEYFFLTPSIGNAPPRGWRWSFFFGPFLLLIIYLTLIKAVQNHYDSRTFTLTERLLTETRVLWDYLHLILFPGLRDLGLFHDDFPISRQWGWREIIAVGGWFLVLLFVWCRRWVGWPLSFAFAWFLCLHLLESTIIPLEIYFEHRNYLPSVGIIIGLGFLITKIIPSFSRQPLLKGFIILLSALYLAWLVGMTWLETRAWGDPRRFVGEAVYKHPDSMRAMEAMAGYLAGQGKFHDAYRLHIQWLEQHPKHYTPGLDLRMIMLSCYDEKIPFAWNQDLADRLRQGRYDHSVDVLQDIFDRLIAGQCSHINKQEYIALIDSLLDNPRYRNNLRMLAFLKKFKAMALLALGKTQHAFDTVRQGINLHEIDFDYLLLVATLAYEVNNPQALAEVMTLIQQRRPIDALLGKGQRDLLQRLTHKMREYEIPKNAPHPQK